MKLKKLLLPAAIFVLAGVEAVSAVALYKKFLYKKLKKACDSVAGKEARHCTFGDKYTCNGWYDSETDSCEGVAKGDRGNIMFKGWTTCQGDRYHCDGSFVCSGNRNSKSEE